jgi:hypothetical protein
MENIRNPHVCKGQQDMGNSMCSYLIKDSMDFLKVYF